MKARLLLVLPLVGAAACGTLFNSKLKTINMVSMPAQAEVWIDDTMRGVTPLTLQLDNQQSHTVIFKKEGHADVVCELHSSAKVGWIILDILGGLVPVVIDAATGDWSGISEDSCTVGLPENPADPGQDIAKLAADNGWILFR